MEKNQHEEPNFIFYENDSAQGVFNTGKMFDYTSASQSNVPSLLKDSVHVINAPIPSDQQAATEFAEGSNKEPTIIREDGRDQALVVNYRLLSAAIIYQMSWHGTIAMDFSAKDGHVLKQSMNMLQELPVMYDHETSVLDWLGIIEKTEWTEKINRHKVAGINGRLNLDIDPNEEHPSRRVIRGVEKGVLNSFSVSVWFDYKKSHPDMDPYEFFRRMGEKAKDGELIRLIVTKIRRYFEGSLVYAGADPLAKRSFSSQPGLGVNGGDFTQLCSFSNHTGWEFMKKESIMGATLNAGGEPNIPAQDPPVEEQNIETELDASTTEEQAGEGNAPQEEAAGGEHTSELESAQKVIQQNADLLTKCSELSDQVNTLQSEIQEAKQHVATVTKEKEELVGKLEVKNGELSTALTTIDSTRKELDAYKEEVQPKLEAAGKIEERFRQEAVKAYNKYTLTFAQPVADDVKQKRLHAILNSMSIDDVFSSVELWEGEFAAAFPEGRSSKEVNNPTAPEDGDNGTRGYQDELAVIDESLL